MSARLLGERHEPIGLDETTRRVQPADQRLGRDHATGRRARPRAGTARSARRCRSRATDRPRARGAPSCAARCADRRAPSGRGRCPSRRTSRGRTGGAGRSRAPGRRARSRSRRSPTRTARARRPSPARAGSRSRGPRRGSRSSGVWRLPSSRLNSSPPKRATTSPGRTHDCEPLGDGHEEAVADVVAERVVHELEAVDVEEQHGNVPAVRRRRRTATARVARGTANGSAGG